LCSFFSRHQCCIRAQVYEIEQTGIKELDEETVLILRNGIANKNAIICLDPNSKELTSSRVSLWIADPLVLCLANERAGFIWYCYGSKTPFGVEYGEWFNHYCWINFVYTSQSKMSAPMSLVLLVSASGVGMRPLQVVPTF